MYVKDGCVLNSYLTHSWNASPVGTKFSNHAFLCHPAMSLRIAGERSALPRIYKLRIEPIRHPARDHLVLRQARRPAQVANHRAPNQVLCLAKLLARVIVLAKLQVQCQVSEATVQAAAQARAVRFPVSVLARVIPPVRRQVPSRLAVQAQAMSPVLSRV